jgi:hypothetical protein
VEIKLPESVRLKRSDFLVVEVCVSQIYEGLVLHVSTILGFILFPHAWACDLELANPCIGHKVADIPVVLGVCEEIKMKEPFRSPLIHDIKKAILGVGIDVAVMIGQEKVRKLSLDVFLFEERGKYFTNVFRDAFNEGSGIIRIRDGRGGADRVRRG